MENKEIINQYKDKKRTYELFSKKLEELIGGILSQSDIEYQSISSRVKDEKSLENKIKKKDKYEDISEITDVCGLRIITSYADTVNKVADIISQEFVVDEENTIDKGKTLDPDRFGYLSLHYVISLDNKRIHLAEYSDFKDIKAEIQIRSISQHAWAEIEHDLGYKASIEIPKAISRDISRLAGLLEIVDKEFIEIREEINKYTEKVKKTIKNSPEETLIDSITLELYAKESPDLLSLNKELSEKLYMDYLEINKEYKFVLIPTYLSMLQNAGFKTIQEIDNVIKNKKNNIIDFSCNVFEVKKRKRSNLFCEDGLYFTAFYNICKEKSIDKISMFLDKSNLYCNENEKLELCNRMLQSYKDLENTLD